MSLDATHAPKEIGFVMRPKLAARVIARAVAADAPFRSVAADSVYSVGDTDAIFGPCGRVGCLASTQARCFNPAESSDGSPPQLPRLPRRLSHRIGRTRRQERVKTDHACMTGAISDSLISMRSNSTKQINVCGREVG